MKLKVDYSVHKRKIHIDLETVDFTQNEIKAIDALGEPKIEFKKTYTGGHTVSIARKLRSEFKIRLRFDGSADFDSANNAGQEFIQDIKEKLMQTMEDLIYEYEEQLFPPLHENFEISNY
jgi:hypothetical protein